MVGVGWKLRVVYLEEAGRRGKPAQVEGAEEGQADVGRKPCPYVGCGGLGEQDLAPVCTSTDPCRLVQPK